MKKRIKKKYANSVLRAIKTPFEGLRVSGKYAKTLWNRVVHLYNAHMFDYSSLRSRHESSDGGVTTWCKVRLINPIPFNDICIAKGTLEFAKLEFDKNSHYIFWCPDTYSGKGCICVCKTSTWEGC